MNTQLSTDEIQTLEAIADPGCADHIPRAHLEKLSRLDLIEPAGCNVTLSMRGKEILFGRK